MHRSISRASALLAPLALAIIAISIGPASFDAAASPLDGTWNSIAPFSGPSSADAGRTSFPLVVDASRNRMIVFGGDPDRKNDVWELSFAPGSAWTEVTPAGTPPTPRYGASAVYDPVGDRMIVFAGYTGGLNNDLWELSFSGAPTWKPLTALGTPPPPGQDVAAVYDPVGQRMILFGGYTSSGFTNRVFALSLGATPQWSELTPSGTPPSPRNVVGFARDTARNRLLIFGGWSGSTYLSDAFALDLAGNGTWSTLSAPGGPSGRRQSYAAYDPVHDALVVFGGSNGANLGDAWKLSLSGSPTWAAVPSTGSPPTARYGGQGAYDPVNARFLVCGGVDFTYRIDVRGLDLAGSGGWSVVCDDVVSNTDHPGSRRDYSLVLDPSSSVAYLFGGTYGYIFNPFVGVILLDTNSLHELPLADPQARWKAVTPSGPAPSARHGQRAVWDAARHRLLMFGGYDETYLGDLWAFTPGPSPSWQAISTIGPGPEARMLFGLGLDPVADRLIVVGGHAGFPPSGEHPFLNDVWELPLSGPNALHWHPLTPGGTAPSPRWIYGMSYDSARNRLLSFGGVTESGRTNDVWALHLGASPAWSELTPAGPPPHARSDHAMIYEPGFDRLVVFGGFDDLEMRNDVWMLRFPGAPTWTELQPENLGPTPRDILGGVFDPLGNRMLLYGGWDGSRFKHDTWTLSWTPDVVPVQATLEGFDAEPGRVRLRWFVPSATNYEMRVERREPVAAWTDLGPAGLQGPDRATFEDLGVSSGRVYEYRLRIRSGSDVEWTAAERVEVPSGAALALRGAVPNPVQGSALRVAFSLPRVMPAKLSLIDPSGRRILEREVGALGAGQHLLELREAGALPAGVYWLRLESSTESLSSKALILH